jgi:hypothetical protein
MATMSWPAQGSILSIDETGSGTYTVINQASSFGNAGGGTVDERDTTVLASTVHTSAPVIPDNGEFTFSLLYDPTDLVHIFLRTIKDVPTSVCKMKVIFNDTTPSSTVMPGWLKEFGGINGDDVDASLVADITWRCSGAPVNVT